MRLGSPPGWFVSTLFARSTMWSPPPIRIPTPVSENGSSAASAEQNASLCVTMLLETRQLCTPLVVPVFRKTRPEQLSCTRLSVTLPMDASRTRTPQRSAKAVLYRTVMSEFGEIPTTRALTEGEHENDVPIWSRDGK